MDQNSLLLCRRPVHVLLSADRLRNQSITDIALDTDTPYAYAAKLVARLAKAGLVSTEAHGRTKRVRVTPKGRRVSTAVATIVQEAFCA